MKQIKPMDKTIIYNALTSALSLLNNEVDSIEFDDLKFEYISAIEKIEIALIEINRDE